MTEQDFLQYRSLERETEYLRKELAKFTADPFVPQADPRYLQMLRQRREDCVTLLMRLEQDIAAVTDSRLRMILSLRYQKGYSWQKVAFAIGESDESYPRRQCKKYFAGSKHLC